jgi:hypothetical protein
MQTCEVDPGVWMIVINPNVIVSGYSRQISRTRVMFDWCWTGDAWARNAPPGLKFDSIAAADMYLQANYERMQAVR